MISTLAEKVDTCFLYILQRAVKYSNGQAGSVSKNEEAKGQLRLNTNVVTLSNQSGAFQERGCRRQVVAEMKLVRTCPTRWGNEYLQLERNNILKLSIDPSLQEYKKANKGLKEAIVVTNDSDQGSKVGKAIAAADIGLTSKQRDLSPGLDASTLPRR
eukprot:460682-Prymnesium_polylepis.2